MTYILTALNSLPDKPYKDPERYYTNSHYHLDKNASNTISDIQWFVNQGKDTNSRYFTGTVSVNPELRFISHYTSNHTLLGAFSSENDQLVGQRVKTLFKEDKELITRVKTIKPNPSQIKEITKLQGYSKLEKENGFFKDRSFVINSKLYINDSSLLEDKPPVLEVYQSGVKESPLFKGYYSLFYIGEFKEYSLFNAVNSKTGNNARYKGLPKIEN